MILSTYTFKDIFFQSITIIGLQRVKIEGKINVIPFAMMILNMTFETLQKKEQKWDKHTCDSDTENQQTIGIDEQDYNQQLDD